MRHSRAHSDGLRCRPVRMANTAGLDAPRCSQRRPLPSPSWPEAAGPNEGDLHGSSRNHDRTSPLVGRRDDRPRVQPKRRPDRRTHHHVRRGHRREPDAAFTIVASGRSVADVERGRDQPALRLHRRGSRELALDASQVGGLRSSLSRARARCVRPRGTRRHVRGRHRRIAAVLHVRRNDRPRPDLRRTPPHVGHRRLYKAGITELQDDPLAWEPVRPAGLSAP